MRIYKHNAPIQSSFTRAKERPVWLFESFFFFLHVRPRTYGHARAKERPVWLLFLARGLKVFLFYFFARTATHVRAHTSLH